MLFGNSWLANYCDLIGKRSRKFEISEVLTETLLVQPRLLTDSVAVCDCLQVLKLTNVLGCDRSDGLANLE